MPSASSAVSRPWPAPAASGRRRDDGHLDAVGELLGTAHRVPLALDHQGREADAEQLVDPRGLRAARRVQREGQAQAAARPQPRGGPGGRPGAGRAAAHHQRGAGAHRRGGRAQPVVEGRRRGGHLAAGHPPRLLEADHGHVVAGQVGGQRLEVGGVDAVAGTVAQQQRRDRAAGPGSVTSRPSPCGVPIMRSSGSRPHHASRRSRQRVLERGSARPARGRCCARCSPGWRPDRPQAARGGRHQQLEQVGAAGAARVEPAPPSGRGSTISGIRSWMWPSSSSASVVITVQVQRNRSGSSSARSGSRQIS